MVNMQVDIEGAMEIEGLSRVIDPNQESEYEAQAQGMQATSTAVGTPAYVMDRVRIRQLSQIFFYISGVQERQLASAALLVHFCEGEMFERNMGDVVAASVEGGVGLIVHDCEGDEGFVVLVSLLVRAEEHDAAQRQVERWVDETRDVGGVIFNLTGNECVLSFAWQARGVAGAMKAVGHPWFVDRVARVERRICKRNERKARSTSTEDTLGRAVQMLTLEAVWRLQAAWRRWLTRRTLQRLLYEVRARMGHAARVRQAAAATTMQAAARGAAVRDRCRAAQAVAEFVARQARVDDMVAQSEEPVWLKDAWTELQNGKEADAGMAGGGGGCAICQNACAGKLEDVVVDRVPSAVGSLVRWGLLVGQVVKQARAAALAQGAIARWAQLVGGVVEQVRRRVEAGAIARWAQLVGRVVEQVRVAAAEQEAEVEEAVGGRDGGRGLCTPDGRRERQQPISVTEPETWSQTAWQAASSVAGDRLPFGSRVIEGRLFATVSLLGHEMRCMHAYTAGLLAAHFAPRRSGGRQRRMRRRRKRLRRLHEDGVSSCESEDSSGYVTAEESV